MKSIIKTATTESKTVEASRLAETLGLIETDPFIFPDAFPG